VRAAASLIALVAMAPAAIRAGTGTYRDFASLDAVPAWAVCTVEQAVKLDVVPAGRRRFPWAERNFEAQLLVRRVFSLAAGRSLLLAAVLIDDRRFGFGAFRYCDARPAWCWRSPA
jgi:hypothetical protein